MNIMYYIKYSILFVSLIFKLFCFIVLINQAWNLTIDYLKFSSNVKLEDKNDKSYKKLPAIHVCTEFDILFNRNKLYSELNISNIPVYEYKQYTDEYYLNLYCSGKNFSDNSIKNNICSLHEKDLQQMYLLSNSYILNNKVLELTINSKDLIDCKLHSITDSRFKLDNSCEDYSEIIESLHGKDLGICFSYFSDRHISKHLDLTLNNMDYIEFKINSSSIENVFTYFDFNVRIRPKALYYVYKLQLDLLWSIYNSKYIKFPTIQNSLKTIGYIQYISQISKITLDNYIIWFTYELSYIKTVVNHLSWPYSTHCQDFKCKY